MSDNLIINNKDVAKVVTILKYVTITFDEISIVRKAIPGEVIDVPTVDVIKKSTSNDQTIYQLLYDWKSGNVSMPILAPNTDKTYTPSWCIIKVPNENVNLVFSSSGTQTQSSTYLINSEEPLYIKGETMDGSIKRNVTVDNSISIANNNTYNLSLTFNINGIAVGLGTQKTYTVKLSLYKDRICSKYIGYINIIIKVTSSVGPGE